MATSNLFCAICFQYYKSDDNILCSTCGHVFHDACLKDWLTRSSTCPDCRLTNFETHPIFLHIEDPSLAKRKLLQQLEESEQNFFRLENALTLSENKCAELNNELQLLKTQIESYELRLSELQHNQKKSKDIILENDLAITQLKSLNSMLEKKITDLKLQLTDILNEAVTDQSDLETKENLNEKKLGKIKQLLSELEMEQLIDKLKDI